MDHDPLDTDGQDKSKAKQRDAAKLVAQVETEDMAWLMGNKRGRRIVWRLLERAGVYRTTWNASGAVMSFNEGMRNFGLTLLADSAADTENYVLMQRENMKASK